MSAKTLIPCCSARVWFRSTASVTTCRKSISMAFSKTGPDCIFESCITSCTKLESRFDSLERFWANRFAVSGSSIESSIASAKRLIAPIGVFSSWETLATKSLLVSSKRFDSVRSSTSKITKSLPKWAARALSQMVFLLAPDSISTSRSITSCCSRASSTRFTKDE